MSIIMGISPTLDEKPDYMWLADFTCYFHGLCVHLYLCASSQDAGSEVSPDVVPTLFDVWYVSATK